MRHFYPPPIGIIALDWSFLLSKQIPPLIKQDWLSHYYEHLPILPFCG